MAVEEMVGAGLFVAALEEDGRELVGVRDDKRGCKNPDGTRGWAESDHVWLDVAEKEELAMSCVVTDEESGGVVSLVRAGDSSMGYWNREDGKLGVQRRVDSDVVGDICRGKVGRNGIVKVRAMMNVGVNRIVGERGPDAPIEDLSDIVENAFEGHDPAAGEGDGTAKD